MQSEEESSSADKTPSIIDRSNQDSNIFMNYDSLLNRASLSIWGNKNAGTLKKNWQYTLARYLGLGQPHNLFIKDKEKYHTQITRLHTLGMY